MPHPAPRFARGAKVYGYHCAEKYSLHIQEHDIINRYKDRWKDACFRSWGGIVREKREDSHRQFIHRPQASALNRALEPGDIVIFGRLQEAFLSPREMRFVLALWYHRNIHIELANVIESLSYCAPTVHWAKETMIRKARKSAEIEKLFLALRRRYQGEA